MRPTELIQTANAIETPAAGRWPLGVGPSVTWTRHGVVQTADEVYGSLIVGGDPGDARLVLSMVAPPRSSSGPDHMAAAAPGAHIELVARLVAGDLTGRWTFVGQIAIDGPAIPVTVHASYRGVFRHGTRAWTEISFEASCTPPGPERGSLTILGDVIFDAPASVFGAEPETTRSAA